MIPRAPGCVGVGVDVFGLQPGLEVPKPRRTAGCSWLTIDTTSSPKRRDMCRSSGGLSQLPITRSSAFGQVGVVVGIGRERMDLDARERRESR